MCAVVLVPFIRRASVTLPLVTAVASLVLALICTFLSFGDLDGVGQLLFGPGDSAEAGMLAVDLLSQLFKVLLLIFTLLIVVQWWITSRDETHTYDLPDYMCLLLGATLGMALMASANNLLMILIAIESASLPSFALAGFRKFRADGSEGALKYVLFGAASSAVMIYGMSLVYGVCGSLELPVIAQTAAQGMSPLHAIGWMAVFVGFAFKLSAVPMHYWCPDVFQGAPIEITTYLSVASKGAAIVLIMRVLDAFGSAATAQDVSGDVFYGMSIAVGVLGAATATWGNLVAIHQNNIKRLLAYSSIAHAGYMTMVAGLMCVAGRSIGDADGVASQTVASAVMFYLFVYLWMNLGAFTVVGIVARHTGSEDLRDYAGLVKRSPWLTVLLILFMLSLFGMPGLGGFMGKIYLMAAMKDVGPIGFALIAVLLINTLISLYFYMRPVYYMVFVADEQSRPGFTPRGAALAMMLLCALLLLVTGIFPELAKDHVDEFSELVSPKTQMTLAHGAVQNPDPQ